MNRIKGIVLKEAFTTSDGKPFENLEKANAHQKQLNLKMKRKKIEEKVRELLEIPKFFSNSNKKENRFLDEHTEIFGVDYEDLDDLIYNLGQMVEMGTLVCKWSEIFRLIEKEVE
ncbi:MAG TPA: hypothetical protein ENH82_13925 [bacterium]|nr:hypothetical protein [bacterium]